MALPEPGPDPVQEIYRREGRGVFATLVHLLGSFELAEDPLHNAFVVAVESSPREGVPKNPVAWLVSAGRFKAIDQLRRRRRMTPWSDVADEIDTLPDERPAPGEREVVEDDRLRLIFTRSRCLAGNAPRRNSPAEAWLRRVRMATRDDLVVALGERYQQARVAEKCRILDEFVAVTGFHRKHAMRLLRRGQPDCRSGSRARRRLYDDAVREALIMVWEASDPICGKRLQPLLPVLMEAMERHGHLQLAPKGRSDLLAMSAATMDRALRDVRGQAAGRARRRAAPSAAIRRSVPVRTFSDWQDPPLGFFEADLVAHSGPVASGSFLQTLVLTDIATGWTECAPLLVRTSCGPKS